MGRDLGMANRLRAAGLQVREVAGWQTRGNAFFSPLGHVVHHTAGPPESAGYKTPTLGICINGRADLEGPLCNWYLGYDNVAYVVASGRANHAGIPDGGNCRGMTGNTTAWGVECEHPGTFPLAAERIEILARGVAAVIKGTCDGGQVVSHSEWAPSRKIDIATDFDNNAFRKKVDAYLKGGSENQMDEIPAWFWPWVNWYENTSRDPAKRPKDTPKTIPAWAWEAQKEIHSLANNHGMGAGEQQWIDWLAGGKKGERPNVPDTIPEFWWEDNEYVTKKSA
jgi:hypothetical protein